jgi:hypothetical protein
MSGHTPGPWSVYPETDGAEICAVDMAPGLPIRQIVARPVRGDNWIANARLIAAAPELLEALREYASVYSEYWKPGMPILEPMSDAAIAKATGEQA